MNRGINIILLIILTLVISASGEFRTMGFIPQEFPDSLVSDQLPPLYRTAEIPDHFDWRNVNGMNYITSVKNQGTCGSCWAFASIAQFESAVRIYSNYPLLPIDLSEQELVSCHPDYYGCYGGNFPIDYFKNNGVVDDDCFPYDTLQDVYTYLPCSSICPDAWARRKYFLDVDIVNTHFNIQTIKEAVYHCPMFLGIDALNSFANLGVVSSDYIWLPDSTDSGEVSVGGHALLCIGWDDSLQYFIFKNSWGTNWGDSGFIKIGYRAFDLSFPKNIWLAPDSYDTYIFPVDTIEARLVQNWKIDANIIKSETTAVPISVSDTTRIITDKFLVSGGKWYMVQGWQGIKDLIDTTLFQSGEGNTLSVIYDAPMEIDWECIETTAVATQCLSDDNIIAYPNPFVLGEQNITISFKLCKDAVVDVKIFDVGYNLVNELVSGESYRAESINIFWDGTDQRGKFVAPGVYFVVIETTMGESGIAKIVARRR